MTLMLLIVLTATHFEDPDLFAASVRDDCRVDGGANDGGLADADIRLVANHKYLIQDNFCAYVRRYLFYFQFFAGGNLVLLAAGFYDRVHRNSNPIGMREKVQ